MAGGRVLGCPHYVGAASARACSQSSCSRRVRVDAAVVPLVVPHGAGQAVRCAVVPS